MKTALPTTDTSKVALFVSVALCASALIACDDDDAAPQRCRTYATSAVAESYEWQATWDDASSTLRWDENPDADWWSGEIRYQSAAHFVEEVEVFGRTLVNEATIVAEIGGLDHYDVYEYDQEQRLVTVSRTTRDVVNSTDETRYTEHDNLGRPTAGVQDHEEDGFTCDGDVIEISYDDENLVITRTQSQGVDGDGAACGVPRATRESYDDDFILLERETWFSGEVAGPADLTLTFDNTATTEVCVD